MVGGSRENGGVAKVEGLATARIAARHAAAAKRAVVVEEVGHHRLARAVHGFEEGGIDMVVVVVRDEREVEKRSQERPLAVGNVNPENGARRLDDDSHVVEEPHGRRRAVGDLGCADLGDDLVERLVVAAHRRPRAVGGKSSGFVHRGAGEAKRLERRGRGGVHVALESSRRLGGGRSLEAHGLGNPCAQNATMPPSIASNGKSWCVTSGAARCGSRRSDGVRAARRRGGRTRCRPRRAEARRAAPPS